MMMFYLFSNRPLQREGYSQYSYQVLESEDGVKTEIKVRLSQANVTPD